MIDSGLQVNVSHIHFFDQRCYNGSLAGRGLAWRFAEGAQDPLDVLGIHVVLDRRDAAEAYMHSRLQDGGINFTASGAATPGCGVDCRR